MLEYGETDLDKMIGQTKDKKLDAFTIGYFWKQIVEAVHAMHQEGLYLKGFKSKLNRISWKKELFLPS